jgi:5-methylcytosine-specific restriction endonuclease McrA
MKLVLMESRVLGVSDSNVVGSAGAVAQKKSRLVSVQVLAGPENQPKEIALLVPDDYDADLSEPFRTCPSQDNDTEGLWLWHRTLVLVQEAGLATAEEVTVRVKHSVIKHANRQARLWREVEAFENAAALPGARREKIPDSVQLFVWQRDQGRCTRCGTRERLEFDHIIPVSRGGATTERNIQLLCESCNREKTNSIGGADVHPLFPADS